MNTPTNPYEYLSPILDMKAEYLEALDRTMAKRTGRADVMSVLVTENKERIARFGIPQHASYDEARDILKQHIAKHEEQLLSVLEQEEGEDQFRKAAKLARRIAQVGDGYFLKKEYAEQILRKTEPANLLKKRGYKDVDELLEKEDIFEIFSALRFVETDEWMHETFEKAYSEFGPDDFEERPIEITVMGPQWEDVAKKFVEKKHHNVSHLKEFGVIFINPIAQDVPGKFMRDFALLFHYFNEIAFYAKMFRYYAGRDDFAERFKSLLRGDVKEADDVESGEWLIVQRYLWKFAPNDKRLYLPRVNPESLHWGRGERDLTEFGKREDGVDTEVWDDTDWVAGIFEGKLVSFDMEDNAMSLVSEHEGRPDEHFTYHQREALWTHLFQEYAGGEEEMEKLLMDNFQEGSIHT